MIREILIYPNPLLKRKARLVEKGELAEVRRLLDDMVETMRKAPGIGLAATQVGSELRAAVLEVPEEVESSGDGEPTYRAVLLKLINPEITRGEGEFKYEEGCLSLPGIKADVKRFEKVTVKALDENWKPVEINAEGLLAVALQHEIDHLDGVLFIERLGRLKRELVLRKFRKLMAAEAS